MTLLTRHCRSYHPPPEASSPPPRRDLQRRLNIIRSHVDFAGKSVLDLGCSGGYFCFALAPLAERVRGVDGDAALIEANQRAARERGLSNVSFEQAGIDEAFIERQPRVDVVLFLSVFHHMLAASGQYDWSDAVGRSGALRLMPALLERTQTLVFEMGYPFESRSWARRLPWMGDDPADWVLSNLFAEVEAERVVAPGPAMQRVPPFAGRLMRRRMPGKWLVRKIARRVYGVDERDFRDIFVIRRKEGN